MPPNSRAAKAQPAANNGGRHWARRLHRWFGVSVLLFVVILSISGVILNHAETLGLNERYVQNQWLLDWYGIDAPPPTASYQAGAHRVTLLGGRLYFDHQELQANVLAVAGAVAVGEVYAVAAGRHLLLATGAGELIESIEVAGAGQGPIDRIGGQGQTVVLGIAGRWYRSDDQIVALEPVDRIEEEEIRWSLPSPIAGPDLTILQQLYRGRGVTIERLMADLHSGRLFGSLGPLVMDAAGVALLVLSISGLVLFLRYRKKRESE